MALFLDGDIMFYVVLLGISLFALYCYVCSHEMGHALAVWFCGGKVDRIEFGRGRPLLSFGKFSFGVQFWDGVCHWDDTPHHQLTNGERLFICLAGMGFNFVIGICTFLMMWHYHVGYFTFWGMYGTLTIINPINTLIHKGKEGTDAYQAKDYWVRMKESKNSQIAG
ncbi:site-2 protease family protein (plasmid) [Aneurinibacillus sp. Ricciae_BoGa-3]|uniref:site-2 protease family protein n=1 Tax=Aneurinibacillus sp. Ricciae_BoGa-3 TaxID=3022697 RepID=UPI002340DEEB|nr:site-2 protease family protein [Aneurinibacillus sp. Ricciae_BoGa-3]WCK57430.1 site-2 protease family protein [Aneurinibacillus sp. Ricciae_BoGa-3]